MPRFLPPLGTGAHQPALPRPAIENTQHLPFPLGAPEQQQVESEENLRRIKELQAVDPLARKPEPGDDELRRLLKERYKAGLFAYKYTDAVYKNNTVSFDEFL